MGYKKGIVEGISMKELRNGQHGQFCNYGLKIGEEWFNGTANEVKSLGRVAVADKDYNEVKKGMEVEFMFETDKYGNKIDKKTFKILASGSASQPNTATNAPQPTTNTTPQQNVPKNASIASLIEDVCKGWAATMAIVKFYGKDLPDNIQDGVERMSRDINSRYFK